MNISKVLDKLSKLTKREKIIVGTLLLIVSSLPFFYSTIPLWNKYFDLLSRTKQDKQQLSKTGQQILRLEKLKTKNTELLKKIETQKIYLPKSYEIDFLVQDLKKICDDSSVSLESFTPSDPEPVNILLEEQLQTEPGSGQISSTRFKEILEKIKEKELPVDLYKYPIEVKISGGFTDIVELLKKLEKYGRVISLNNITITKIGDSQKSDSRLSKTKKQDASEGLLSGSFDLIGYSLPAANESISPKDLKKTSKTFSYTRTRSRK